MKPGLLTSGRGSFGPPLCRPELIAVRKVRSASGASEMLRWQYALVRDLVAAEVL